MNPIPIKMFCREYFTEYKVYCYKIGETIVSNGCEQFHPCKTCYECCAKSVEICKENLYFMTGDLTFHKP